MKALIIPFIQAADDSAPLKGTENGPRSVLVASQKPDELVRRLALELPAGEGRGEEGLLQTIRDILENSVNTWDQGFMDKLYASTNPVSFRHPGAPLGALFSSKLTKTGWCRLGAVAGRPQHQCRHPLPPPATRLTNQLHVYQVSPALTVVEKHTAKALANLFGFTGPRAGGVTCQGGSSSNLTSIVIARNTLASDSKIHGNPARPLVLFTSEHGHYSVEKAAMTIGLGSNAVRTVPVDAAGRMDPVALRAAVIRALAENTTPFYVNATAGTTVLGSYDPFPAIAAVCAEFKLWLHVDASWGGPAIFSPTHRAKLAGVHLADSLTVNPHKMMNVPVTCSFLLGRDTAVFHRANTLPAGYLFHADDAPADDNVCWDLADLTLQCGRRGDALKLALAWIYYGAAGFARQVDGAFEVAAYFAERILQSGDFVLVSENPPPCLQVCFYYAPGGRLAETAAENTARTKEMVRRLVARGFMVDYAPGPRGSFFRVVVNVQTLRGTVDGLVGAIEAIGGDMGLSGGGVAL